MNMNKIGYTAARIVFGGWFLFFGIEYFTNLGIQPYGTTPLAREFTFALIHSGLFTVVKLMEIAIGALILINRGVLPAALACVPLTGVIAWWNFVLNPGVVEYIAGFATVALNILFLWPYRKQLMGLLVWRDAKS
jgi:hypothetical protein